MANKDPVQNEEFKAKRFQKRFDEPMASKVRGARFPEKYDRILEKMPDRSDYIRNAVIKQLIEDGLLPQSDRPPSVPLSDSPTDQTSEQSPDTPQKKADRIRKKSTMIL